MKLDRAIQLALQHNAEIANAQLDVQKAGDRLAAFHTRLLPSLHFQALGTQQLRLVDFTIERGQLGNFEATGPIPSNDVKFSTPLRPTGLQVTSASPGNHNHRMVTLWEPAGHDSAWQFTVF